MVHNSQERGNIDIKSQVQARTAGSLNPSPDDCSGQSKAYKNWCFCHKSTKYPTDTPLFFGHIRRTEKTEN